MAASSHSPISLLVGAALVSAVAGCGVAADAQPPKDPAAGLSPLPVTHHDPGNPEAAQVLPGLERALVRRLPAEQYGCTVAPPDPSRTESGKLWVLVATTAAARDAQAIVDRLGTRPYVSVRVSPRQWREHDRRQLIGTLKRQASRITLDGRPASKYVAAESEILRRSCPRVEIALAGDDGTFDRWARRAKVAHAGRVVLRPPVHLLDTSTDVDARGRGLVPAGPG